jgi:hypothetical protein
MRGNKEKGRAISIGSALLFLISGLSLWLAANSSPTWSYFSNTLQELATISTGFWEAVPGQSGTSLEATKTAEGRWEQVDGVPIFSVVGEICVTNRGEQPTQDLVILDIIQSKARAGKFTDSGNQTFVDLGQFDQLAAGESRCYGYDVIFSPDIDLKYRNVAHVTITNHSGWIPGGHNCPGPDPCPFGPAPKTGFEIPPPPEVDNGNISAPVEYLPDTGSPLDSNPEGKLIELPMPDASSPESESASPAPTQAPTRQPSDEVEPKATAEIDLPTPTLAPTMDSSLISGFPPTQVLEPTPTNIGSEMVNPTPTLAPTVYAGPPGCSSPVDNWRLHPGQWKLDWFILGGIQVDRQQALDILAANPRGDASYTLAQQYIAAQLNIASPADPTAVAEVLDLAAAWFSTNPPGSQLGNPGRKAGLQLAETLEAYNLGDTGPGSCEVDLWTPTPTRFYTPTSTTSPLPTPAPTMAPSPEAVPASTIYPTYAPTPTPAATQALPAPGADS